MPGGMELIAILVVIVLLFGAKRIPEMAKGIGEGIRELRNATKHDEVEKPNNESSASHSA